MQRSKSLCQEDIVLEIWEAVSPDYTCSKPFNEVEDKDNIAKKITTIKDHFLIEYYGHKFKVTVSPVEE